jgi:hypothetical protein
MGKVSTETPELEVKASENFPGEGMGVEAGMHGRRIKCKQGTERTGKGQREGGLEVEELGGSNGHLRLVEAKSEFKEDISPAEAYEQSGTF